MKTAKMLTILVMVLGLMVWSGATARGDISLTVNGQTLDSVTLKVGQSCTVEVVSSDSDPYSAYVGFDNGLVLGTFSHQETSPGAGVLASVIAYNVSAFYGYYISAAGITPSPSAGVHFVLEYTAQQPGETDLKLYDNMLTSVMDSIHITIVRVEMGNAFTYQGRLLDAGSPADGLYGFRFKLYDGPDPELAVQQGSTIEISDLVVIDGHFTVELDFGSGVFNGDARWLETKVVQSPPGSDPRVLRPLQEVTPVPYALQTRGIFVDSAGNVGIGTTSLTEKLTVEGRIGANRTFVEVSDVHGTRSGYEGTIYGHYTRRHKSEPVRIPFGSDEPAGTYRLGTVTETYGFLAGSGSVVGPIPTTYGIGAYGEVTTGTGRGVYGKATDTGDIKNYGGYFEAAGRSGRGVYGKSTYSGSMFVTGDVTNYGGYFEAAGKNGRGVYGKATYSGGIQKIEPINYGGYFEAAGKNGRGVYAKGGPEGYAAEFDGNVIIQTGRTITPVLEITGGSDLSEQFEISSEGGEVKPGMVVSIDAESPGDLVVSTMAYDRRVAGIISGAGGVQPGMLMGQEGSDADGENPVALTGRVYCWADASKGPIQPGDLLTSSDTPGHAMKVTDYTRAQGAILGKAMSSLESGRGLVLVLVTLQ